MAGVAKMIDDVKMTHGAKTVRAKRVWANFAVALLVAASAVACGDDDDGQETADAGATGDATGDETGDETGGETGGETGDDPFAELNGRAYEKGADLAPARAFVAPPCEAGGEAGGEAVVLRYDGDEAGAASAGSLGDLVAGDKEAIVFRAEKKLLVRAIRVGVAGEGDLVLSVWRDFGKSWPMTSPAPEEATFVGDVRLTSAGVDAGDSAFRVARFEPPFTVEAGETFFVGHTVQAGANAARFLVSQRETAPTLYGGSSMVFSQAAIAEDASAAQFKWLGVGDNAFYRVQVEAEVACEVGEKLFVDATEAWGLLGLTEGRTTAADLNGDGLQDLVLHRLAYGVGGIRVLMNRGGSFEETTASSGLAELPSQFVIFGDVDNDGDLDLFGGVHTPQGDDETGAPLDKGFEDFVALNDGTGVFAAVAGSGVGDRATTSAATFLDVDNDGVLDLFMCAWLVQYPNPGAMPARLLLGNGDGTFADVSAAAGLYEEIDRPCYGATAGDVDNDGDVDIVQANYGREPNYVWRNEWAEGERFVQAARSPGVMNDIVAPGGGNNFGVDLGDLDNDGDLDIVFGSIAHPRYAPTSDRSRVLLNRLNDGADTKKWADGYDDGINGAYEGGMLTYDEGDFEPSFGDLDNDGWLDVFMSVLYPGHYARIERNAGVDGATGLVRFENIGNAAGVDVHYAQNHVLADFDNDGDLDVVMGRAGAGARVHFFENTTRDGAGDGGEGGEAAAKYLALTLEGVASNRAAIGARVVVEQGAVSQLREVKGGKGHFGAGGPLTVHVGLSREAGARVDRVTVRWPSGATTVLNGLDVNEHYRVTEGRGVTGRGY